MNNDELLKQNEIDIITSKKNKIEEFNKEKKNKFKKYSGKANINKINLNLFNNIPLNNSKESYISTNNIQIPKINQKINKVKEINKISFSKFFQSKNFPLKLGSRNNKYLSPNLSKNNIYELDFKKTFTPRSESKLILRSIDIELNNLINKKNKNKIINLKTVKSDLIPNLKANFIDTFKKEEFNKNNETELKNDNSKRNHIKKYIKKNKSEKKFVNIYRNIIYLNQKNSLISSGNFINLNQNEEDSLTNQINQKENLSKLKKAKTEKTLSKKFNNSYIENLELKKKFPDINKKIQKLNLNLKATYDEDNIFEYEKNVDNYIAEKKFKSSLNSFKNKNLKIEINKNNDINDFRLKNNFISKTFRNLEIDNISDNNSNEIVNKDEEIKKNNQIISQRFNKKFSIFNPNKKRKSIIEGYLLNYNNKSEKSLNNILKLNKQNKYIPNSTNNLNEEKAINTNSNKIISSEKQNDKNNQNKIKNIDLFKSNSNEKEKNNEYINLKENMKKQNVLINNNLNNMNIIYEEKNSEMIKDIPETKSSYVQFTKNKIVGNKFKNKDIIKYFDISKKSEKLINNNNNAIIKNKENNNINLNNLEKNKYTTFNMNQISSSNNLNKKTAKKKSSKNYGKYNTNNNNNYKLNQKVHIIKNNTKQNLTNEKKLIKENKKEEEKNESKSESKNFINNKKEQNISSNNEVSIIELSFLNDKNMNSKEKLILIKEYKEKSMFNLHSIVKNILEIKIDLQLNIETLTKFLLIDNYKKYFNILKTLIEKERNLSGIAQNVKIKDEDIIKYIYRMFSDEFSAYFIKSQKPINIYGNINDFSSNLSKLVEESNSNSNLLSHRRYLSMHESRRKVKKLTSNLSSSKLIIENETRNSNFKKSMKRLDNVKTIKEFLKDNDIEEENKKKIFLSQKLNLTNELKYQIKITHDEEGKGKLQNILNQIEAMKSDDIKEDVKLIHEKYDNFRKEVKKLIKDREREERINSFLDDLIYYRRNISELKKLLNKFISIKDYII